MRVHVVDEHRLLEPWAIIEHVVGQVMEGMDVVDAISKVKTGTKGSYQDVPLEPVVIVKAMAKE